MFSVHYNQGFFDAYFDYDKPAFVKVKNKGELPSFTYVTSGFEFANLGGVPISKSGKVTAIANYKITLKCDVCNLPIATKAMKGNPQEYTMALGSICSIDFEMPFEDKKLLQKAPQEVLFRQFYKEQCTRCGRWIASGKQHQECLDAHLGVCKYCAVITQELIKIKH